MLPPAGEGVLGSAGVPGSRGTLNAPLRRMATAEATLAQLLDGLVGLPPDARSKEQRFEDISGDSSRHVAPRAEPGDTAQVSSPKDPVLRPFPSPPAELQQYLPGWPPKVQPVGRRRGMAMIIIVLGGFLGFVLGIILAAVGAVTHVKALETIGAILLLGGILSLVYMASLTRKTRAGQVPEVARVMGLQFSPTDPFDLTGAGLPFEVFLQRGVEVRNVMWGTVGGVPLQGFDVRYEVRGEHDVGWQPTAWRFMTLAPLSANCPPLWIGTGSSLQSTEKVPRVRFESIQFNEQVRVLCAEPYFATALVDEKMMAWMLDQAPRWTTFEVNGPHVLARLDADDDLGGDMGKVMIGLSRFVEHVPPVVRSLYPLSGPSTTGFRP